MREKERQMRGRKILESQAHAQPVELFKLKQFVDAPSRLHNPKRPLRPEARQAAKKDVRDAQEQTDAEEGDMDLAAFEAEVERLKKEHAADKQPAAAFRKDEKGCPAYLRRIKEDMADKERRAEEQRLAPKAPPGCRALPAEEVAETLAALKKRHADLEAQFRRLPLKIETAGQKQRQQNVLTAISQVEKHIKQFSQANVYVEA